MMGEVVDCIENWYKDLKKYAGAKGRPMDGNDKRIIATSMLPSDLHVSMVTALEILEAYPDLISRLESEVEYFKALATTHSTKSALQIGNDKLLLGELDLLALEAK